MKAEAAQDEGRAAAERRVEEEEEELGRAAGEESSGGTRWSCGEDEWRVWRRRWKAEEAVMEGTSKGE